jgi:hypothetical protein
MTGHIQVISSFDVKTFINYTHQFIIFDLLINYYPGKTIFFIGNH